MSKRSARGALAAPVSLEVAAYPCALAWSARGDRLAIAGDDGAVALIELSAAGAPAVRALRAHDGPVQSIAWSPRRDELLTTGQDGAARLWRPPFDAPVELIAPGRVWAEHACWSPSGERAAVALGACARVISPGGPVAVTPPVGSTIAGLAFSPSGKSLGVACYGGVRLFDPSTGAPTRALAWKGAMLSIAFAPDGSTVAGGCQDLSVHFWRIASGKDAQMTGYPAKPRSVSFSHDGRWLATSGDAAISLWPFDRRGPEGRAPVQLAGHAEVVSELAYAPLVDLLLSGDRAGGVALWAPPQRTAPIAAHRLAGKVTAVAWGADGAAQALRWAAADEGGHVLIGRV